MIGAVRRTLDNVHFAVPKIAAPAYDRRALLSQNFPAFLEALR